MDYTNIHFIACSNNVSAMDMVALLVYDLLRLEKGIVMYDVLVLGPVMSILCDKPRASEVLNQLGSSATKFCRIAW